MSEMMRLDRAQPDRLLFHVARLFHETGWNRTRIAKKLGVSVTHVASSFDKRRSEDRSDFGHEPAL
jgi:DNA-binding transcriptional regulator LsrR (DeoR family)